MTAQPKQKYRRSARQVQDALKLAGLRCGKGQLTLANGKTVRHGKIVWIDDGGTVWHGNIRNRVIDVGG